MEAVRAGELEEFASRVLTGRGDGDLPPITPQRARAQARNPVAEPGDIVLFAAYSGPRLVGYLGALPGWLRRGNRITKVYWGSTWFLLPEFRKTSAGLLLARNFKGLLPDGVFTDLSPVAWKLIIAVAKASELGRYRYWRLKLKRFPGPLKSFVCRLVSPLSPQEFSLRETERVREEAGSPVPPLSPPAEFLRGPQVVNWMLRYPWVVESGVAGAGGSDYCFSHRRRLFRMTAFEVYTGSGREYRGYFVISFSSAGGEITMKILDYHFPLPSDLACLLPLALRQAAEYQADLINIPGELIPSVGRTSLLRRLARPYDRPYLYYPWTADSPLALAAQEIRLAYPDGDTAFT